MTYKKNKIWRRAESVVTFIEVTDIYILKMLHSSIHRQ